ncbi:MAG: hypothetical protein COS07_00160 [Candidatus Aenigmarchaeota archaeon CG01_land_8_20_14_3_00_37_9]|nr:MAG: hypothetical protein COS07_00160 [Candidatus Aenigmarchaeota archaeon CG01_land_8_20_14_3_00_37_9]
MRANEFNGENTYFFMIQSINPRTGKIIKIFSSCKKKDVHDAVKRSKIAQRNWADKKPEER